MISFKVARIAIALLLVLTVAAPAVAATKEGEITEGGVTGCRDEAVLNKIERFAREGDMSAVAIALADATARGGCVAFERGQRVLIYDTSAGHLKIRRRGDPAEYWTDKAAVKVLP